MKADAAGARHRHRDHQRFPRFRGPSNESGTEVERRQRTLYDGKEASARSRSAKRTRRAARSDPLLERAARREPPSLGKRDRCRRSRSDAPRAIACSSCLRRRRRAASFTRFTAGSTRDMDRYGFFRPYRTAHGGGQTEGVAPQLRGRWRSPALHAADARSSSRAR